MTDEEQYLFRDFMGLKQSAKQVMYDTRIYYDVKILTHDIMASPDGFIYDISLDWLYPVYQKIADFMHKKVSSLDVYAKMLLVDQFSVCQSIISSGKSVLKMYSAIVTWIKIYNEKVLEK